MTESERQEMQATPAEIEAVAAKLETFAQGLPAREREVLELALARGAAAISESDVTGLTQVPFSVQLGLLSGLTRVGVNESNVLPGRRVGFGESNGMPGQRVGLSESSGLPLHRG